MFSKLRAVKKLAATAGIVAGLALLAPSAASAAEAGYQQFSVSPGQTKCLRATSPSYSSARGEAYLSSGHNSRFTFGTYAPSTLALADSGSPVGSFVAEARSYITPYAFPGYFQVCAINQSQKLSTVMMRVSGI